jgi:hypothetical protein
MWLPDGGGPAMANHYHGHMATFKRKNRYLSFYKKYFLIFTKHSSKIFPNKLQLFSNVASQILYTQGIVPCHY